MGSLLFGSIKIQGQTFDSFKPMKSKAGVARPIVFGTVRPVKGNIIATTEPEVVKRKHTQSGGLFGPDIVTKYEEVYRTYAIRICEGPIDRVERVWRNSELVYVADPDNYVNNFYPDQDELTKSAWRQILSGNSVELTDHRATFYHGDWDQMPDFSMQQAFGVENVHGYRGTAYMVVSKENLTATGGAIPQWVFEVTRCHETPMGFDVEGEKENNPLE